MRRLRCWKHKYRRHKSGFDQQVCWDKARRSLETRAYIDAIQQEIHPPDGSSFSRGGYASPSSPWILFVPHNLSIGPACKSESDIWVSATQESWSCARRRKGGPACSTSHTWPESARNPFDWLAAQKSEKQFESRAPSPFCPFSATQQSGRRLWTGSFCFEDGRLPVFSLCVGLSAVR